jgi:S-methylmethionine-dependent homocysteine/selenocysteine methylase
MYLRSGSRILYVSSAVHDARARVLVAKESMERAQQTVAQATEKDQEAAEELNRAIGNNDMNAINAALITNIYARSKRTQANKDMIWTRPPEQFISPQFHSEINSNIDVIYYATIAQMNSPISLNKELTIISDGSNISSLYMLFS